MQSTIEATPGTRDVDNPLQRRRTDLDLGVDARKAALLGVAPVDVDRTVRAAVAGLTLGSFREADGDEFDLTLRLPMQGRPTLEALDAIEVASASGRQVPLRQLAAPAFASAPTLIRRHDRMREAMVTAYTKSGYNTGAVTRDILERLQAVALPPGYGYRVGGEALASQEAFGGIGTAVLVAVFGIFAVLVLEFGSFRSMLIVAGVIPLGVSGGLIALALSGYTLSFTATIGFVALIGIEIKNSILLVDFTNQLREQGVGLDEAISAGGRSALSADPAHLRDGDRRPAPACDPGIGALFTAGHRDHRRADLVDPDRPAGHAGDVQDAAAARDAPAAATCPGARLSASGARLALVSPPRPGAPRHRARGGRWWRAPAAIPARETAGARPA